MSRKRTSRRKAFAAGLLAGAVVLAVAASQSFAGGASHNSAAASGVIVDGTTDTVVNIDPANQYDYGSGTLDLPLFQGRYGFPYGAKLQPVLADGTPMTSADVKWSFDRVNKIKGDQGIYTLLSNLKSVSVSGAYTVVFHLKTPQSTWPLILSTNAGYIVPKAKYPFNKIVPNTSTQIGTGPYQLVKFTPGQQAVLKPNPNYWGPKPKNSGIVINYYSKSSTMKLALTKGEIDMAFRDFTPTELGSLRKTKGVVVHEGNGVVIRYLVFNVTRPPFDKLAVRQALAYLMPRQTIASRVYHGSVQPLYSMVPAGLPGHIDAFKSAYGASPNVGKAAAALKAAGVTTPVPVDIWWTPSHYGDASADEYTEIQR